MHPSLRSKFLQMEADLDQLIKDLSGLPEEKLAAKPAGGGWSVLEVMQHLMVAERGSLAYVKKKSSYPDHFIKAGWQDGLRNMALKVFLFAPLKFKAPEVVNETKFDPDADFEDLVEKWRKSRADLMNFLEEVPDDYLDKLIYRHAFAGRLTLDSMLIFFRDHFRRHRKQIDRVLKG